MVAVEAAAAEGPIRAEPTAAVALQPEAKVEAKEAEEEREYKSDMRKLEELMSKLNPSAQEFVPLSRRAAPVKAGGGGALSADAPVFVSAAEFFGAAGMNLPMGGGGSRDSSSDGSSNGGGGQPLNRRVGELWVLDSLWFRAVRFDGAWSWFDFSFLRSPDDSVFCDRLPSWGGLGGSGRLHLRDPLCPLVLVVLKSLGMSGRFYNFLLFFVNFQIIHTVILDYDVKSLSSLQNMKFWSR
jgi:hypothetical protein